MYNLLGGSRSCQVGLARVILKVTVAGHARQAGPPHLTVWQRPRTAASLPAHKFIAGVTLEQHGHLALHLTHRAVGTAIGSMRAHPRRMCPWKLTGLMRNSLFDMRPITATSNFSLRMHTVFHPSAVSLSVVASATSVSPMPRPETGRAQRQQTLRARS